MCERAGDVQVDSGAGSLPPVERADLRCGSEEGPSKHKHLDVVLTKFREQDPPSEPWTCGIIRCNTARCFACTVLTITTWYDWPYLYQTVLPNFRSVMIRQDSVPYHPATQRREAQWMECSVFHTMQSTFLTRTVARSNVMLQKLLRPLLQKGTPNRKSSFSPPCIRIPV